MDLEQDYVIYSLQVSLTFIAVSAAHYIELSDPLTFLFLSPITVLFGYTAFISREKARWQSTLSLVGLSFLMLGGIVAAVALIVAIGNILVSIFSGGEGFTNYYSSTSLPLLFTGLILGASIYGLAATDHETASQIRDTAAQITGTHAEAVMEKSNMLESQKSGQARLINLSSDSTMRITNQTVLQATACSRNSSRRCNRIRYGFSQAEELVDEQLKQKSSERIQSSSVDISQRVSDLVSNTLQGKAFLIIVPAVAFGLYGFHPLIGIFTAIWASLFSALNTPISKSD